MANLQLPANWRHMSDAELRTNIDRLDQQIKANWSRTGGVFVYLRRLDQARLHLLCNEMDRRIQRAAQRGATVSSQDREAPEIDMSEAAQARVDFRSS